MSKKLGNFYSNGKKWLVHIWIGIPLVCGLLFLMPNQLELEDIHVAATSGQNFWKDGIITRPGLRGRKLLLELPDGDIHRIHCIFRNKTTSGCLIDANFPLKARVELFEYRNRWIILSIEDKNSEKHLFIDQIKFPVIFLTPNIM